MSSWQNRFASLAVFALLAACHTSRPRPSVTDANAVNGDALAEAPPAHDVSASGNRGAGNRGAGDRGAGTVPAGTAASAPVPDRAAQQYADALKLMRAGRAADAEHELKQLSAAYPQFAGPEINLGLLYLQGTHLPEAEAAFKAALDRNPANPIAGNELGIVERKLGKFSDAEAAYQRTIAAEPGYAPTYLNLGVLYDLYLAEPQKALEQFEHYIQLAGDNKQVAGWVIELRKRVGSPAPAAKKESA